MKKPKNSLEEYTWLCHSLFGAYMDAIWGFQLVEKQATQGLKMSKNGRPPFMSYIPKNFDPKTSKKKSNEEMNRQQLNTSRADTIIERNKTDGKNSNLIAQSIISTIYNYWEDKYRKQIFKEFGLTNKNSVKSKALGDLRNSIVHNKGFAKKEVEQAKVFKWYKENEYIVLNYDKMIQIKNYIMYDLYSECLKESNIEKR